MLDRALSTIVENYHVSNDLDETFRHILVCIREGSRLANVEEQKAVDDYNGFVDQAGPGTRRSSGSE